MPLRLLKLFLGFAAFAWGISVVAATGFKFIHRFTDSLSGDNGGFSIRLMPIGILPQKCGWFALLLAVCLARQAFAQAASPQIAFLHLKLGSNQVTLVSASVSPGVLKRFPEYRAAIDLELATASGQVLWTNSVANPSIRHLEYEDPDHPGEIINKEVQLTNTEFTVRVPVLPDAHHVNFFLSPPAAGTTATDAKSLATNAPAAQRKLLGSVLLPQENK